MRHNWPTNLNIKYSARAKYLRLKLCPRNGLQLVIPNSATETEAWMFFNENQSWLQKHCHLIENFSSQQKTLPTEIFIASLNKRWAIVYKQSSHFKKLKLQVMDNVLTLYGHQFDYTESTTALKNWLMIIAEKFLLPLLTELSKQFDLPFKMARIRNQTSRWGSCTDNKVINLNVKLLFAPLEVIKYVLIHELCHTKHLNHSKNFWGLVEKLSPNYKKCISQLKKVDVPVWL